MKIAVIGNSHIAAVKYAWEDRKIKEHELTWFGLAARDMSALFPQDKCLVIDDELGMKQLAHQSGRTGGICTSDFDSFLICGCSAGIAACLFHQYLPYSSAALNMALSGFWEDSIAFGLIYTLRQITDKPVWFVPTPLLALNSAEQHRLSRRLKSVDRGHFESNTAYQEFVENSARFWRDQLQVILLPQPVKTVENSLNTRLEYSVDSIKRLTLGRHEKEEHDADENVHMNPQYGQAVLDAFFSALDSD